MAEQDKKSSENPEIYFPDLKSKKNYRIESRERTPFEKGAFVIDIRPPLDEQLRQEGFQEAGEFNVEDLVGIWRGSVELRFVDKSELDPNYEPSKTFVIYQRRPDLLFSGLDLDEKIKININPDLYNLKEKLREE